MADWPTGLSTFLFPHDIMCNILVDICYMFFRVVIKMRRVQVVDRINGWMVYIVPIFQPP